MAGETENDSSFGVSDFTQQFVGSTYDLSFTVAKGLNSNPAAVNYLDAGARAIGGTLLVGGVVIGVAQDGLNGGVKAAITGYSAIEGAELGAAVGFAFGGPIGAAFGTVFFGFGANILAGHLYDSLVSTAAGPAPIDAAGEASGEVYNTGFALPSGQTDAAPGQIGIGGGFPTDPLLTLSPDQYLAGYVNRLFQGPNLSNSGPTLANTIANFGATNAINSTLSPESPNSSAFDATNSFSGNDFIGDPSTNPLFTLSPDQYLAGYANQLFQGPDLSNSGPTFANTIATYNGSDGINPALAFNSSNSSTSDASNSLSVPYLGETQTFNQEYGDFTWGNYGSTFQTYGLSTAANTSPITPASTSGSSTSTEYDGSTYTQYDGSIYTDDGDYSLTGGVNQDAGIVNDTGSYDDEDYDYGGYDGSYDYGGYDYAPVVLDLGGKGVNITQLSSSNTFFDATGDGYEMSCTRFRRH